MFDKQNIISVFRISNNNNIDEVKSIIRDDIINSLEEINKQIVEHNISTVFNLDRCTENYFYAISQSSKDAINSTNIISKSLSLIGQDLFENLEVQVSFAGTVEFYLIPENMEWDFDDLDLDNFIKYEKEIFTLNKKGFINIDTGLELIVHDFNDEHFPEVTKETHNNNQSTPSTESHIQEKIPLQQEKPAPISRSERLKQISSVKSFSEN